ncbi:BgTH12-07477, partial [Blumeria graminis f. sp. triticale]
NIISIYALLLISNYVSNTPNHLLFTGINHEGNFKDEAYINVHQAAYHRFPRSGDDSGIVMVIDGSLTQELTMRSIAQETWYFPKLWRELWVDSYYGYEVMYDVLESGA